ncbi:MAG TPA: 30S ribosome-binding factor RbfA [Afifellaceae bacterium]|nr:30S ribosome-binding factor RbfA [Afifellaceae bacterium]
MPRFDPERSGQPSQRQLRVGELVRHAIADVMTRGEVRDPELEGVIVTISEVRMSPDLKVATALVTPLGDQDGDRIVDALNRNARFLRGRVAPALRQMRQMPELRFRLDTRFEESSRIDELLRSPEVARDLEGGGDEGSD